ncbi:PREDICTED: uncharacterized protein LOC108365061 isoform X1 [Rhagoletis zephyria]|uniref:uncharacterized protein LOC108365061 isoform X1 n=1 Tax=Rhagoletis zephyria TaxID=28612 RepID=UPI0008115126|nr:PREDICTED: uncharacterized protein LOC108365061 isoform X1 [Rhagoletis zephyria]
MSLVNEELIAAIFEKPSLWDQQNKYYYNRCVVERNWNEIAMALNQDTAIIKKKWKQLRDTFRTELKKIPPERSGDPGPGGSKGNASQWPHFTSMLFIRDQIKCRKSSGNLTQQKPLEKSIYIEDEDNNSSIDMDINKTPKGQGSKENYSVENSMSTFEVETPNTSQSARKKLKRNDEVNAEIIKIEKRKLDLLEQKSKQKIQTDDEDMAFFVSLLPHIKKMDKNFSAEWKYKNLFTTLPIKTGAPRRNTQTHTSSRQPFWNRNRRNFPKIHKTM